MGYPLENEKTATTTWHLVHYILMFGIPQSILTDQGANFESRLISEVCSSFKIAKLRTAPYYPQTDGLTERMNRSILEILRHLFKERKWAQLLDLVLMAYCTSVHSLTGHTQLFLFFLHEATIIPVFSKTYSDILTIALEWANVLDSLDLRMCRVASGL